MTFSCVCVVLTGSKSEFRLCSYIGLKPSQSKLHGKMVLFLQKRKIIIYSLIVSTSVDFISANKGSSFRREQQNIQGREKKIVSQQFKDLDNLDNRMNIKGR